ncbi:hypothetical protein [Sinorhizobium alkalisoli]|uniref:hypothetical protein n=1 Tax=Sinorhizobium alkalisoli TaxID=1752398 RepID=UPI00124F21EB|nr:hypothetical protein [Sinorhizobium alkalisoli]QFI68364.1 hypothetical protein EKH55_3490 [Sinorhizobium alkalisoli]
MTTVSLAKEFSVQRLQAAVQLVTGLLDTDWAYPDSAGALRLIQVALQEQLNEILDLDDDTDEKIIRRYGIEAQATVSDLMGFIGFIVRSSDVRNSFEIYAPIKEISSALLGDDLKIVVGSEWSYNPFVYPLPPSRLENYIFVGLPASEAQNALLVPVAGHELGHAVWRRTTVRSNLVSKIAAAVIEEFRKRWSDVKTLFASGVTPETIDTDLMALEVWGRSNSFAQRQCEEIFCDLLGLWIFGDAFLAAFEYILSPDSGRRTSEYYPPNKVRARHLARAAADWDFTSRGSLPEAFSEPDAPRDTIAAIAQDVTQMMVPDIQRVVEKLCSDCGLVRPSEEGVNQATERLRKISPTGKQTPAEILVAAWAIRDDLDRWSLPGVKPERKLPILNDLVLKSFEVHEWINYDGQRAC